MKRIPEPDLMSDDVQAKAYAHADFDEPHSMFIDLFRRKFSDVNISGNVLDLGCGTADISLRFANSFSECSVTGLEGADAMLQYGCQAVAAAEMGERVHLVKIYLPVERLPRDQYEVIISNSLLHHLKEPMILWETICRYACESAPVFVMDLLRPKNIDQAHILVNQYAAVEPEILRRDFFNSLLAAYELEEVRDQLKRSGLDKLVVEQVSDRHFIVSGLIA